MPSWVGWIPFVLVILAANLAVVAIRAVRLRAATSQPLSQSPSFCRFEPKSPIGTTVPVNQLGDSGYGLNFPCPLPAAAADCPAGGIHGAADYCRGSDCGPGAQPVSQRFGVGCFLLWRSGHLSHAEAEFLGVSQVLIYVGAISTLITFAIMLTRGMMFGRSSPATGSPGLPAIMPTLLILCVGGVDVRGPLAGGGADHRWRSDHCTNGSVVCHDYVVPFELMALLLLVALAGDSPGTRPQTIVSRLFNRAFGLRFKSRPSRGIRT